MNLSTLSFGVNFCQGKTDPLALLVMEAIAAAKARTARIPGSEDLEVFFRSCEDGRSTKSSSSIVHIPHSPSSTSPSDDDEDVAGLCFRGWLSSRRAVQS